MFDQSIGGLGVLRPVDISGPWETLAATAERMAAQGAAAAEAVQSASTSWDGLREAYREAGTEHVVYTAFVGIPEVTQEWSSVLSGADAVLQAFATEAASLQRQAEAGSERATQLEAQLTTSGILHAQEESSSEDTALVTRIHSHNEAVVALNNKWEQLQQQVVSELDSIGSGGGLEEEIPKIDAATGPVTAPSGQTENSVRPENGVSDQFQLALGKKINPGQYSDHDVVSQSASAQRGNPQSRASFERGTGDPWDVLFEEDSELRRIMDGKGVAGEIVSEFMKLSDDTESAKYAKGITGPLGIALGFGTSIMTQYQTDEDIPEARRWYRAGARAAFEVGGPVLVSSLGAGAGAAVGLPFTPPIAIGAAVAGGVLGGWVGNDAGELLADGFMELDDFAWDTIESSESWSMTDGLRQDSDLYGNW